MTTEQISSLAQDVAAWTIRLRDGVIADLDALIELGYDIPDFATAHDFCDANMLGECEEAIEFFEAKYGYLNDETPGSEFNVTRDIFTDLLDEVQNAADAHLKHTHKATT